MLHSLKYVAIVGLVASMAFAQFDSATVLGSVRDAAQAQVPGATVTLTNVGTSVTVTQETGVNGEFQFVNVRPGNYTLKVQKQGFAVATASQFTVTVGARQRVD